jgi:uncharacterized membrane protein
VHPFDLKAALLPKHAQHVVLVHFPIALFLTGVALDVAATWTKRASLAAAAYANLSLAAISTFPVLATGVAAWQWQLEGQRLKATLLLHLMLGCISGVTITLVWWLHFRVRQQVKTVPPAYRFVLELVGALLVGMTGYLGGILSGVNGTG